MKPLRIAMLHLAPITADVAHNRELAERGLARAVELGAEWIITPELFISGYKFRRSDRHRLDTAPTRRLDAKILPPGR